MKYLTLIVTAFLLISCDASNHINPAAPSPKPVVFGQDFEACYIQPDIAICKSACDAGNYQKRYTWCEK